MSNKEIARSILDSVTYMVLATADADGLPWASPVWFATDGYDDLYWISAPDALHSRNIAARAEIGIVVFDSTTTPATRQALYVRATAERVDDPDAIAHGVAAFTRSSGSQGLGELAIDEVTGEAGLRLYHARAQEHWILEPDLMCAYECSRDRRTMSTSSGDRRDGSAAAAWAAGFVIGV